MPTLRWAKLLPGSSAGTSRSNTPWAPAPCPLVGRITLSNCLIFFMSRCRCGWRMTTGRDSTPEDIVARQMALASNPTLVTGTQTFLLAKSAVMAAQSPELLQRAHALLNAPHLFGYEIGVNVPAFLIALVITAILVVGIKESARFNATIVTIKVGVVLFVIGL